MMTSVELNRKGFKALVDALGYADAIRFIRQYNNGSGNYTKAVTIPKSGINGSIS